MLGNENRCRYDRTFKIEALRLVTEDHQKVTEVARELGNSPNQARETCYLSRNTLSKSV